MDEELTIVRRNNGAGCYAVVLLAPDGSELVFGPGVLFDKGSGDAIDVMAPNGKVEEKQKPAKV